VISVYIKYIEEQAVCNCTRRKSLQPQSLFQRVGSRGQDSSSYRRVCPREGFSAKLSSRRSGVVCNAKVSLTLKTLIP